MENDFMGKLLYHYCPLEAFISIIKNKELWLSCADDTNDKFELGYVSYLVREMAKKIKVENPTLQKKCDELIDIYKEETWYDRPYIVSFSRDGTSLSQWRLYADDAKGVAIGFSSDKLQRKLETDKENSEGIIKERYSGYKVKYADKEYMSWLQSLIMKKLSENDEIKIDDIDVRLIAEDAFLKDEVFKFEDEYRILYYPKLTRDKDRGGLRISEDLLNEKKIDFRIKNGRLVSFRKTPIDGCIEKLLLGSKCECNISVVQKFLTSYGFDNVSVEKASSPYR